MRVMAGRVVCKTSSEVCTIVVAGSCDVTTTELAGIVLRITDVTVEGVPLMVVV